MFTEEELKEMGIELESEAAQKLIEASKTKHQQALDAEVEGLKRKNKELLTKQSKLKEEFKKFEGIDPERARQLEQQIADNEEAQLIAEGKLDEVLQSRTERMRQDFERKLEEAQNKANSAQEFSNKFRGRVMSDEIRKAAAKAGVIDSAIEDAILNAEKFFEVNDEGKVVPKESAGLDEKGQPLSPEGWMSSLRDSKPHWFPTPEGSGAPGSSSSSTSPRAWKDAKTAKEKAEYLKRQQTR